MPRLRCSVCSQMVHWMSNAAKLVVQEFAIGRRLNLCRDASASGLDEVGSGNSFAAFVRQIHNTWSRHGTEPDTPAARCGLYPKQLPTRDVAAGLANSVDPVALRAAGSGRFEHGAIGVS